MSAHSHRWEKSAMPDGSQLRVVLGSDTLNTFAAKARIIEPARPFGHTLLAKLASAWPMYLVQLRRT